jgi:hypothetical protein
MLKNYFKPLLCLAFINLISACGGGGEDAEPTPTPIKVEVTNTSPELGEYTSTYQMVENITVIAENITVSDAENDSLTASFTGDDADLFSFDIATGKLAFKSAPDYEAPSDSDLDNIYIVELSISDSEQSVTATIEVTIINDIFIEITSPVENSNVGGGDTYKVVAKIEERESDDLTVMADTPVLINGRSATPIDDSRKYWVLEIENIAKASITAEVTFEGITYSDVVSVQGLQPLVSVKDIAVDETAGFMYLNDQGSRLIVKASLDGSTSKVFFNPREFGYSWVSSILLDSKNNRLLAVMSVPKSDGSVRTVKSIIAIDLTTKAHDILSGELIGSGDLLSINSGQIAFYHESLLIPDYNNQSLVKIDLLTGNRTTLSSGVLGTGPLFDRPTSLAVNSDNNLAYVSSKSTIHEVDLLTGNRAIIGDNEVGTGTALVSPEHLFFDGENNRLIFLNSDEGITTLNLNTKERIALPTPLQGTSLGLGDDTNFYIFNFYNNSIDRGVLGEDNFESVIVIKTGQGLPINNGYSTVFSGKLQKLFVNSYGVYSFDLLEQRVSYLNTGTPDIANQIGLSLNTDDNSLVVINNSEINEPTLLLVNTEDTKREVITEYDVADDVNLINPIDVVLNDKNTFAYILDAPNYQNNDAEVNIIQVELATGVKTLISNNATHPGVAFNKPNSISFQSSSNSLLVIQSPADEKGVDIIKIEITTGERSLMANDIDEKVISAVNDSLFLEDGTFVIMDWRFIYKVNLATGESNLLSSNGVGDGIPFGQLSSISYDSINNRIYAVDTEFKGIFAIDISTGNRSLLVSGN